VPSEEASLLCTPHARACGHVCCVCLLIMATADTTHIASVERCNCQHGKGHEHCLKPQTVMSCCNCNCVCPTAACRWGANPLWIRAAHHHDCWPKRVCFCVCKPLWCGHKGVAAGL
jgi:hypothetical protein